MGGITEIIVRLQNKDKAKKGNKTGDQDKSPQPPSSTAKDNKISPSKSFKTSPSKHSKSKPKTSQNDPSKQSKNIKKEQNNQQTVNIPANSNNPNKRIQGKMKPLQNNNHHHNANTMKTEPPPKAFSGPNYGQNPSQSMNNNTSSHGMNRNQNSP